MWLLFGPKPQMQTEYPLSPRNERTPHATAPKSPLKLPTPASPCTNEPPSPCEVESSQSPLLRSQILSECPPDDTSRLSGNSAMALMVSLHANGQRSRCDRSTASRQVSCHKPEVLVLSMARYVDPAVMTAPSKALFTPHVIGTPASRSSSYSTICRDTHSSISCAARSFLI